MKAMVYQKYGSPDNLELREIEKPVVKDDEMLVKVHAASVSWLDWHFLKGDTFLGSHHGWAAQTKFFLCWASMWRGGLKQLGKTSRNFSRAMRYSGQPVTGALPSMCVFLMRKW